MHTYGNSQVFSNTQHTHAGTHVHSYIHNYTITYA